MEKLGGCAPDPQPRPSAPAPQPQLDTLNPRHVLPQYTFCPLGSKMTPTGLTVI